MVTGYRLQVTCYMLQVTGYRFQVSGFRFQVSGYRLQVTGYRLKVTGRAVPALWSCSWRFHELKLIAHWHIMGRYMVYSFQLMGATGKKVIE